MARLIPLVLVAFFAFAIPTSNAAVYYVSNDGADDNPGTSPEKPWKTLARVNRAVLKPGDSVLFQRGDVWRGTLRPKSGSDKGRVRYADYGTGPKPLLLGSVEKNRPEEWKETAPNIWTTGGPPKADVIGKTVPLDAWHCYYEEGAKASVARATKQGDGTTFAVTCNSKGTKSCHIQFSQSPLPIEAGRVYRVRFKARCTVPVQLYTPTLMKSGLPWTHYSPTLRPRMVSVDTTWKEIEQLYAASTTTDTARLTFFLGTALPKGATLYLADATVAEVENDLNEYLARDVGNIIFDHEASCGVKVWEKKDLKKPGQYWYDEDNHTVSLYCKKNPAEAHQQIECALRRHIIDQSLAAYVTYENLALKYGAAHGIGGSDTKFITVRNCDIGYIGGGDQRGGEHTVRFGNGVEFWRNAHDCLVEGCRIWEVYDAALTNQGAGGSCRQVNILYRNNVIWNSEYSFEYWNRPETSLTKNVVFENNVCMDAGYGWGHAQRPDPSGRHLCFYTSPAKAEELIVRNNVFYRATKNAFYAPTWSKAAIEGLTLSNNVWFQPEGTMIYVEKKRYPMSALKQFQADYGFTAKDVAPAKPSVAADPFTDNPHEGVFELTDWARKRGTGRPQTE